MATSDQRPATSAKFRELVLKLREILQVNRPDLDFGVYRILNARSDEITDYLENRLHKKVNEALTQGHEDRSERENAVFSHLLTFFSRYYDRGDFISQRRYKGNTYAIPYAGEEVMLHWANKDQYYTKSGENFSNYRFKLDDERSVYFRLVSADTAKDNRKDNDENRCFVLATTQIITRMDNEGSEYEEEIIPIEEVTDEEGSAELVIRFDYRSMPKKIKQDVLLKEAVETVLANKVVSARWLDLSDRAPTEKQPQRTLLEKHLTDYTAKNNADYFIHKNLGGFLRQELDFYIKNEVMNLDDVQNAEAFSDIEKNLRMIQCLRAIAHDLIAFMAQLEDFQKKLWLKKKFVVSSHYCITLDRVPLGLYEDIVSNEQQWNQWKQLGVWNGESQRSIEELKGSPYRMVDTSLFDPVFKAKLLSEIDDLDEQTDGLLIHSENFQALQLLKERYREQVKCVYIDPPFNLERNADFLYKTDYKDSSWASLLETRLKVARQLLSAEGMVYVRCDINGNYIVRPLLDSLFGRDSFRAELLVQRIRKNTTSQGRISMPLANDSLFFYTSSPKTDLVNPFIKLPKVREAYWRRIDDSAGYRNPPERFIFGKKFTPYKTEAHFKYSQTSIERMIGEGRIRLICKECKTEHLSGEWLGCVKCKSLDATPQYKVLSTSTKVLDTNWTDIAGYSHKTGFATENSEVLLQRAFNVAATTSHIILDFFAGSGTSLAVALKSGREWLGVEQGEQINQFIIPRLVRDVYSENLSNCFKVLQLESYEDTLNNLVLRRSAAQGVLFDTMSEDVREDYLLHYMLDVESRGSLLSVKDFEKPFDYEMQISTDSAGAYEPRKIDLVETFNYLIGLRVKHVDAQIDRGFVRVTGSLPSGESCLILWRDRELVDYEELNKLCERLAINGDHNIPTVLSQTKAEGGGSRRLKLRQIEPEFLERMFSVEDV